MRIVLVGNYAADGQESMQRYSALLHDGLLGAGHDVRLVVPAQRLTAAGPAGWRKWVGYVDKFVLALPEIMSASRGADIVHVCDHSNAMYVPWRSAVPYTATCHDLIAVRGALGEIADCPASPAGKFLQRSILRGLGRASAIACVSRTTLSDVHRLLPQFRGVLGLAPNALNFDYRPVTGRELDEDWSLLPPAVRRLSRYVLLVGSAHPRKNRETAIRALARLRSDWKGVFVFAGEPLSPGQRELADRCGVADRIVEVVKPGNKQLRALYNNALALLFPSRFEGFGWPVIEAQACGCPVVSSDRDPLPDVSGSAALHCDADDEGGYADHLLRLDRDAALRSGLVERGLANASSYTPQSMIRQLEGLFEQARREVGKS